MKKICVLIVLLLVSLIGISGCGTDGGLSPDNPVTLTMWHVYGEQADSPMNRLVEEFNETVGREKGILINITMMSNTAQIGEFLKKSKSNNPGSPEMPDLFFAIKNNALELGIDNLIDWNNCFTEEERTEFIEEFMMDGIENEKLIVLPVSKSTHMLFMNGSQFKKFSEDMGGISEDNLSTWTGFFDVAQQYYNWSDGKSFCAFDYLLRCVDLNALSRGGDGFYSNEDGYDFNNKELKEAWMQFARALVQGHVTISDLYSNTQVMTGEALAGMGSSAAVLYYNDVVTYADNTSEPINLMILPMPYAANGEPLMTQTGVGLCGHKTTEEKEAAMSVFAHWLVDSQRNLDFVVETGYMPVKKDSFEKINDYVFEDDSRKELYSSLGKMITEYKALPEPYLASYYAKVKELYDQLRERQPEFIERIANGETVEDVAEETWWIFSDIFNKN